MQDAPPPEPERPICSAPHWLRRPSADDLKKVYPGRARQTGEVGQVRMVCEVTPAGTLADCAVESETRPSMGFGHAAIRLATRFKVELPRYCDGSPAPMKKVTIPILFRPD